MLLETSNCYIAVVGLGCVLPDAFSVGTFWTNALAGHCALRELSGSRWDWRRYYDPSGRDSDRFTTIVGATIQGWQLDWRRFRIPPADASVINPLALMTLDAGAQALDGLARLPAERTGVFLGATGLGWQRDAALRIRMDEILKALGGALAELPASCRAAVERDVRQRLDARLGPVTEDAVVNGPASTAAGRLAMLYDLRGLHYAVDAGFASGLAALDVGVRALRDGTVDAAVVGGVSELLNPLDLVAFSRIGGLARETLKPFDADADGTLLGEGVAMFVLKRLDDALRDGERVYAIVRGVGGASDGRGRSLLAPLPEGQARAMRHAYADACVDPRTIRYVECHATGTPVGDRSELEALQQTFGSGDGIWIGSGKAAVGHLRGGAGAVGLLRATLALSHGIAPRQVGFARPTDALSRSGFTVPRENLPLEPRGDAPVTRAAVSAFGFGGIGYHAVLEAFDPEVHRPGPRVHALSPPAEPIAIVGMGGVFPGADDVPGFWRALLAGLDATREVPKARWDVDKYYDPNPTRLDTSYTRLGCFLDRFVEPDPRWGIPPSAIESLDPSHLLCLKAAEEALADAGIDPDRWDERERAAVMLGFLPYQGKRFLADFRVNLQEVLAELERRLAEEGLSAEATAAISGDAERRLKADLPRITEDSLTGWLGSLNAGRITRRFDLHGPHFVVDAACASTHGAVHAAVQALRHRTADVVLTGGVWADMQPEFFVGACRFNALSATGSTPFDAAADGFIPGEGGGVLVLRRLEDAVRDGQRVHAVIRGVAGASDGKGRSVLAPTVDGESLAMRRALADGSLRNDDVGYVECHGTGTALGDAVEVEAITRVYGGGRGEPLRIGSVKSNIGHLNAAAGVPGLIKAALAVRNGVIPPSLKVREPNPRIDFAAGPVEIARELARWERPVGGVRRAGVSSFGVGGANMHVILEEFRPQTWRGAAHKHADESGNSPLPIARVATVDPSGCLQTLEDLARRFAGEGGSALAEPVGSGEWRAAVVAPDPDELARRLSLLRASLARGDALSYLRQQGVFLARPGAPVVATFPGQGPHYANMARELAAAVADVRETLDEADQAYRELTGRSLLASFWTDDPDHWEQADEEIHCAVYAVNLALYRMLERRGVTPVALVGQSAGELSALAAAGSLSFADGLRAVHGRTRAVLEMPTEDPGTMIAVRAGAEAILPLLPGLPGYAALAADNGPSACIVSASGTAQGALIERLRAGGIEYSVLAVSHGYHSQLIAGAMPAYHRALRELRFAEPRIPIVSTITGRSLAALTPAELPDHLVQQFIEPVRLREAYEEAWRFGGRLFVECGPKWSLTTFAGAILQGREHWAQAMLHPKVGEREQAARALACLWVHRSEPAVHRARFVQSGDGDPVATARIPRAEPRPPKPEEAPVEEAVKGIERIVARSSSDADGPSREQLFDVLRRIRDLCDEVLGNTAAQESDRGRTGGAESPAAPDPNGIARRLVAAFAERTGYPEEMLEPRLDLEADLGIDTVKQIAVLGQVREELGLARDPDFVLRDHPTIAALADYLASRVRGEEGRPLAAPPTPSIPATHPPGGASVSGSPFEEQVLARLRAKFSARTGYPEEMLEADLDLEADLGIDTVKQVAVVGELRKELAVPVDPAFQLRQHPTLASLARYLAGRTSATLMVEAKDSPSAPVARENTPFPSFPREGAPFPPLAPELARVFERCDGSNNGAAIAAELGRPLPDGAAWVHRPSYDTLVGSARFEPESRERLASLLQDAACWHAELLWATLLGIPHRVHSVGRIRLDALPEGEARFVARLAPRRGGKARADVRLYDAAGAPLGIVADLEGIASDGAELRSWGNLVERLSSSRSEEGSW